MPSNTNAYQSRPGDTAILRRKLPAPGRLILASNSPRRRELLAERGYEFIVQPAEIDESTAPPDILPREKARFLAMAKAHHVAEQYPADVVLGADTIVAFGDMAIGKPADRVDAKRILTLLSNTTHIVVTGIAVLWLEQGIQLTKVVHSGVHMRALSNIEIEAYLNTGLWEGKAGAYGIQDQDPFVTRMAGSHSNIVGLPIEATIKLLKQVGINPKG